MATVASRRQHLVRNRFLLGRQRRIQWALHGEAFVDARCRLGMPLLLALQTRNRVRPFARGALLALRTEFLHALVGGPGLVAQRLRERIPLRLLRIRNF